MAAEFGRLAVAAGDAVVYIDEWSSGANFETLSDAIDRATRGIDGVPFLPVAMLTDKSCENQHYQRRVRSHDDLLKKMGGSGEEFRCVFPPLPSRFSRGEGMYFFWSEHDRIAGYRKMQVLGALLSSIDAAREKRCLGAWTVRGRGATWSLTPAGKPVMAARFTASAAANPSDPKKVDGAGVAA